MNYKVSINNVQIIENKMIIAVSGEIEDEQISRDIYSKPKLIMLFDNEREDRRIPFVISDIGYFGDKCRFSGEYTYLLDMLFWKTRADNLDFKMKFALSYGNCYFDEISIDVSNLVLDYDNEHYVASFTEKGADFTVKKQIKKRNPIVNAICNLFLFVLHVFLYILGICLIPVFLIEAVFALISGSKLAISQSGNIIGDIIGHVNRKIEMMSTIKLTIRKLNRMLIITVYKFFKLLKVKKNRITFISARRTDVSGNFAFVYDEMKKREDFNELDVRFVLNEKTIRQLNIVDIIKFCKACATSKVIVLDEFTPQIHYIDLRKDTKLVQLWHACGAFKTFGFTRLGKPMGSPQPTRNHRSYDFVTVSSEYCKKCHSEGFGIPYDNVVPTGIPRTDVFFDEQYKQNVKAKFYAEYPELKNKKIIMFAPTFRGDVKETSFYPFEMFDVEKFCKDIPSDYAIIIKHHPFITKKHPVPAHLKNRVYDMSDSTEINDLLFVTDLIITDYSSLVFEASLLNIPMLFYVFDLNEYIRNRDFYFDLRQNSPGKLVFSFDEMVKAINENDFEEEKIDSFMHMFFDKLDGKSTQRVVNMIIDAMK